MCWFCIMTAAEEIQVTEFIELYSKTIAPLDSVHKEVWLESLLQTRPEYRDAILRELALSPLRES